MLTQNNKKFKQEDDYLSIQDLLGLCISKWYWFVIALSAAIGVAVFYLLSTPPVYTRSASILIKEDSKGQSFSGDVSSTFSDMGLFQVNTNVNNELISLQSPAVMMDVVKQLNLDVDYKIDGSFHKKTLYGQQLPFQVQFLSLQDNETASFTLVTTAEGYLKLSDFIHNGKKIATEQEIQGALNDTITTPVGKIRVIPTSYQGDNINTPIYVSRVGVINAIGLFASNLGVALNSEKATVIDLFIKDVCIQRAEDILNTLIAVYNENWVKDKNQIAVSTSMFINERLGVIERELGNVDEDISSYKSEHLLPDVQTASSMYMEQSSENNAQILTLNTQLSMARYIRNYLTSTGSRNQLLPANSGLESGHIEQQISEYNTMQLQRNNLVANSSEQNPLVMDLDQSLKDMRSAIISSIDNLVVTLNTRIRSLQQNEKQTAERIAANPSQAKYLLSVERQQKVKEALYLFLLQKREENELSQAFTAYNTRVITPPHGSMIPTAPVRKNIFLVAIALGILIPVVVIFLKENINTTVRGKKDLEGLSLPIVGEIPLIKSKKDKEKEVSILVEQGNRNIINEAFRVLRTNFEFITGKNKQENVILITSFNPGSGKSFLLQNLAYSLVLKNKKVLLIDGDLRKATSSSLVGSPQKGLSDFLSGRDINPEELLMENPRYPQLQILPVGIIPPNPAELLEDERMGKLLEKFRSHYDYIFIDCPPVDIVADTQILNQLSDRTLFVVRAGLLKREMLPELEELYENKRFRNMAVILNGTQSGSGRYGYKYGYHYGRESSNYYSYK